MELSGSVIALMAGMVAVMTGLAKVIEKLVDRQVQKKNGDGKKETSDLPKSYLLSGLREDMDRVQDDISEVKTSSSKLIEMHKDDRSPFATVKLEKILEPLPHALVRIEGKVDAMMSAQQEEMRETRKTLSDLKTSIDRNTQASEALRVMLERILGELFSSRTPPISPTSMGRVGGS